MTGADRPVAVECVIMVFDMTGADRPIAVECVIMVFAAGSARATEELHLHQELLVRAAKRRDKEPEADEEPEQAPCEEKMEQEQAPVPESPVVPPPPEPRIRHKKFRKRQKLEEKEENGAEVISSSILLPEKSVSTQDILVGLIILWSD